MFRYTVVVLVVSALASLLSYEIGMAGEVTVQVPQDEFVPLESVPPEDQLPAAPLLIAAYALLWVGVLGYLWSIWRRLMTMEQELSNLASRTGEQ